MARTPSVVHLHDPGGSKRGLELSEIGMTCQSVPAATERKVPSPFSLCIRIVLDSVGDSYQDAEQQLIAQGSAAVPFLQEQLPKKEALQQVITQVVLEWIKNRKPDI